MTEREIFFAAIEIADPIERVRYLDQACGEDSALRQAVEGLLSSHQQAGDFLERPAVKRPDVDFSSSASEVTQAISTEAEVGSDEEFNEGILGLFVPSTRPGSIGRLTHYEILQVLGQGAFGTVFKAFDEKLQRHVAIKTMNVQMAATSPPRKRFLREARAAAAIRHDNVTQVYSVEEEPIPYLVMEYIDGQTLARKLDNAGPLEIPELLHLGRQIATGLAAAHEQGLVHRDIKPGNILLEKGADQKVKLTDFGLARAADDASLTQSGVIAGTPLYMAPEQAQGQSLDARTDLFSFGSVLYTMASGHPPFRAPTTVAVLRRVVDDAHRPLREVIPELPAWFAAIVDKLLAKKPENRFQSAKEVADLLARCQSELQLTGKVMCVSTDLAGSVSDPDPPNATQPISAEPARDGRSHATAATKPARKAVLYAILLGVLVMSPIMFGRYLSPFVSSLIWSKISTLPAIHRAAGLRFDGVDDFVQVQVNWDLPQFTIEAFVTPEETNTQRTLVELTNYGSGHKSERLELYDGMGGKGERLSFAAVTGRSGSLNAYGPRTPGIREHRTIVCDGQEIHYYINGVWQGKRRNQPQDNQLWRMRWLTIGCQLGHNNFFRGEIDQLRISKVARYTDNFPAVTLVESDDATLALYNFEEGTGHVLRDVSGNGHDARINGAAWIHPAQGLQFDGVDDYVEFHGLSWNSNQYTIEAYISHDGGHGNIFQVEGTGGMLHMYLNARAGGVGINRDHVYTNANGPRNGKTRQHLALVYDGKNLNYFVQGELAGVKTNVTAASAPMPLDRMIIGAKLHSDPGRPEFFEGRLETLRVSSRARYVLPFTPGDLKTDHETLALYDFTSAQGDVVKDASGRSADGKIFGATWVHSATSERPSAGSLANEEWIDALSLINPLTDKIDLPGLTGRNEWKLEHGVLAIGPDPLASKLVLPLDSAWSSFECELDFIRRSGANGLNLNIPTRTGECSVVIDHSSGKAGVFLGARGKGVVLSEGAKIETGKRTTVNVTVRRQQLQDHVTVTINGTAAGEWTGHRNDIGKESTEQFPVSRRISLWIHEGNNEFEFRGIRIRPLDGEIVTALRPGTGRQG